MNSQTVNYAGLQANQETLNAHLWRLQKVDITSLEKKEEKAYWINAFNAFTLKLIIDAYPIQSIRDLYDGNPWDGKWINLGKETLSLNDIEKDKLWRNYGNSRIHLVKNYGAKSCPINIIDDNDYISEDSNEWNKDTNRPIKGFFGASPVCNIDWAFSLFTIFSIHPNGRTWHEAKSHSERNHLGYH